jgi:hypothetical protein
MSSFERTTEDGYTTIVTAGDGDASLMIVESDGSVGSISFSSEQREAVAAALADGTSYDHTTEAGFRTQVRTTSGDDVIFRFGGPNGRTTLDVYNRKERRAIAAVLRG